MKEKEHPTIGMLLDIEHIYGQHESRITPIITSLLVAGIPPMLYVYFGWFEYIPLWIAIPVEIIVIIRTVMIILGREGYRLKMYKRQLFDEFTTTSQYMNIKTIHDDGLIEYLNGNVVYLVCCFNGSNSDPIRHSAAVRKFITNLIGEYNFDIYIHNITATPELREYYKKVAQFNRNASAVNFIKIIDYSMQLVQDNSLVQCTIYAIKGRRSDWKDMKKQIDTACNSQIARVYKTCFRVDDPFVVSDIIDRNIDTTLNLQELLRTKYVTGNYDTSKVIVYDLPEDKEVVQGKKRKKKILQEQKASSFHQVYKET